MRTSILKVLFALIAGIILGAAVIHIYDNDKFDHQLKTLLVNIKLKEIAYEYSDLHLLLIKDSSALKKGIEERIPENVKTLDTIYRSHDFGSTDALDFLRISSDTEKDETEGSFALLYVLNEKFAIQKWNDDAEFIKILDQAAKAQPKYVKWLRCKDWKKPMWIGKDECTKKK